MKKNYLFIIAFSITLIVKAQCGPSYSDNASPRSVNNSIGISFTTDASCSGTLTSIAVDEFNNFTGPVTDVTVLLYIGNGVGAGGAPPIGQLDGIILNPNNTFDFSAQNISMAASTQYTVIVDVTGSAFGVGIQYGFNTPWNSYTGGSLFDDDVEMPGLSINFSVDINTCFTPSGLDAIATGETTAIAAWFAGNGETDWEFTYGLDGFDPNTSGTTIAVTGSPFVSLTGLAPGTNYNCYVRGVCNAGSSSLYTAPKTFTTQGSTLSIQDDVINNTKIFPNPTSNQVTITTQIEKATVFDITGKIVMESRENTFNVETLQNGIYLLEIITDNGIKVIKRLVKQ